MTDELSSNLPRAALVTGGARRIGRAVALDLAAQGFAVAVHYSRSAAEAEALAAQIRATGGDAATVPADLMREDQAATLVERAAQALGRPLGVLVNNASTFERDDVGSATRASWDLHMEVNLRAPFVATQGFARQLPAEAVGLVVNMLDSRVWNPAPHFTTYTLSKVGLWSLTRTLALELAPRIRVVGIGPGPALPSTRQTREQFDAQAQGTPLEVGTSPEQIAQAVRYLLRAPSVTGQMLALDGGLHLGWSTQGPAPVE